MTDLRETPGTSGPGVAARRLAARPVLRRPGAGRGDPGASGEGAPGHGAPGQGASEPGAPGQGTSTVSTAGAGPLVGRASAPPPHGVWTAGREHTATLARVGVWLLVLSGPVSLVWLATSRPGVAPPPAPVTVTDPGPESAVAAAAEDAALGWLVTGGGATGAVGQAVTVDVTPPADPAATGPQIWSVLVAVGGAAPDSTPTYLQVPLVVEAAGDRLPAIATLGQPAVVPGPAQAATGAPSDYGTVLALSDPRAATAAAFVTALLTGGDVTPLTSPGSAVRAVVPPPATRVEVRSVVTTDAADDAQEVEVAVSAELTSAAASDGADPTTADAAPADPAGDPAAGTDGVTRTAIYYLALASRDGRWEIAALRPGPVVSTTATAPAATVPAATDPVPADR